MTSCLLPLLLVSLPLLLLWPLTVLLVSVRTCPDAPSIKEMDPELTWIPPPDTHPKQGTTLLIVALTPLGALGLWLVFTTRPVQTKLMRPLLRTSLRVRPLRRLLTVRAAPGW